ncbi:hypothetical protein V6N00_07395 [Tersicoccus sp. MR15.9]|uniref:hypothetical protein n=1 Tax=Tersicoccus mangrovi TaxID=3121635 RepID=UPI002FE57988
MTETTSSESIRCMVDDDFPEDLDGLSTAELHVLHSRVVMQLDHEYLELEDPHPVTMDRHACVARLLRMREAHPVRLQAG